MFEIISLNSVRNLTVTADVRLWAKIRSLRRDPYRDLHVGVTKRNDDGRFIACQHILKSSDIIPHVL